MLGAINWKNTAENLGITIVIFLVGSFVGFKASTSATDNAIAQLKPTIEKAIDKETIKNEIKNEIDLNIDKVKKSDSIQININQKPDNKQKPINILSSKEDCKIDVKTYNKLTKSQKSRLDRWVKE